VALTNLRTHADKVQHSRRPTSAPVLNRFYLFYISFSSSIYLWGTPRGPISQPGRSPPRCLTRPGFSSPDSGSWRQAAPWSFLWPIARRKPPEPSPAKDFSKPVPLCRYLYTHHDGRCLVVLIRAPVGWPFAIQFENRAASHQLTNLIGRLPGLLAPAGVIPDGPVTL
jgi:hypothetical protein